MKATVKKRGNSAAIQTPPSNMQAAGRGCNEVVAPSRQHELSKLLKGITSKNQHAAVDLGPARGKEAW